MAGDRWKALRKRRRKWIKRHGKRAIGRLNAVFGRASRVGDTPWHDPADFAWTRELERHGDVIRAEAEAALAHRDALPRLHEIQREQYRISADDHWKSLVLYGWGHRSETGCRLCPETARRVGSIPGMQSAFFSILAPGAHIPEHRGFDKALLRYQLGVIVPEKRTDCTLWVEGEPHHWTEGEGFVFDDTYLHEVRNDTNQERVALLVHFERPMNVWGRALHRAVLFLLRRTAFVKEAVRSHREWEERFRARLA